MKKSNEVEELPDFETVAEINLDEVAERARKQVDKHHVWKQRGVYLVCTSCDFEHAVSIGAHKILTGYTQEGHPIIVDKVMS